MREITVPDPSLVVLVGAAGAGKSTFASRVAARDEVLSSDAYRLAIAGDAADQRASGLAFRRLHDDLAFRMRERRFTVVDATNVGRHARRVLLARAEDAGVPAVVIILDLPPAVVHARNAGRSERVVPVEVVADHLARLRALLDTTDASRSLAAEGFHAIVVLRDPAEVDAVRLVRQAP